MGWARRIWNICWDWPTTFAQTVACTIACYLALAVLVLVSRTLAGAVSLALHHHAAHVARSITGFAPFDVLIGLRPLLPLFWANNSRRIGFFAALAGLLITLLVMLPDLPDLFSSDVKIPRLLFITMVLILWLFVRATDGWEAWRARRAGT